MEKNSNNVKKSESPPEKKVSMDPPFIRYMLELSTKNRTVFLVGDPSLLTVSFYMGFG